MKVIRTIAVLLVVVLCGCTANQRAKQWGSTASKTLPAGEKLVNVTWKNNDMWILTRPMKEGESAETYTFQEESSFGLLEGKVVIQEVAK